MVSQEVLLKLSILVSSLLVFLTGYYMIILSDQEFDFINTQPPELLCQAPVGPSPGWSSWWYTLCFW